MKLRRVYETPGAPWVGAMKGGDSGVVDAFSDTVWSKRFRSGLLAVRDVVYARDHLTPDEEHKALRVVADHPAFNGLGLAGARLARGKWITQRVVGALDALREQLPPIAATAAGNPTDKAALLWVHALSEGLHPDKLARRFPDLLPGRTDSTTRAAAVLRVRGAMWLPGNRPLRASEAGITAVYYAMTVALQAVSDSAPTLAETSFDYEWKRLIRDQPREQRQLVTLLCFLAPEPLPLSMLRDGWEAVPSPLRRTVRCAADLARLVEHLTDPALVASDLETVTCSQGTQERVSHRLNDKQRRRTAAGITMYGRVGTGTRPPGSRRATITPEPAVRVSRSPPRQPSAR